MAANHAPIMTRADALSSATGLGGASRGTPATLLLVQGVSPRVVMETLGHSQVSLTLNTYSHVLPALQEDAASKMDAILAHS